ncbi:hypothetical protein P8936_12340 [Edaphobacter paludis]|uniref:Uncharacterized protein n=1 Tax=Edaphobacter paludis TaxID=3035702 RepID=A0AAU7D582_9BACT
MAPVKIPIGEEKEAHSEYAINRQSVITLCRLITYLLGLRLRL